MDPLQTVLKDLQHLYMQLAHQLTDPKAPGSSLSRRSISQLSNKIYPLIDGSQQSAKAADQNKHILLQVFSSHLTNYINNHILSLLIRCQNEESFIATMTQGWQQFKRFTFTYHALLIHAKDFFEKESINARQRQNYNYPHVLPVAALALRLFAKMIVFRYRARLQRVTLQLLGREREREYPQSDELRLLLSIYWGCSLGELARVSMSKMGVVTFWKQKSKQIRYVFKEADRSQEQFKDCILTNLLGNANVYYSKLYEDSLRHLNAFELAKHLDCLCQREEQLAQFHLPSDQAVQHYLFTIRNIILSDLEGLLDKPSGFKQLLINSADHLEELMPHAMICFSLFRRLENKSIPLVSRLVGEAIIEKGAQIFSTQLKPRQQIASLLKFKRSIRRIFDASSNHSLDIEQAMEKQFRKLLEPLECSKNLAEYSDFQMKECVRLKLDNEACGIKFRDILFLLTSLSAKDSFLMHYQEFLSRRLLDGLNEPRLDIEDQALKMMGQQLGIITIAHHLGMVKDIEKSIGNSELLHSQLPFLSYKWDLRVFNPAVWPQSSSKLKYNSLSVPLELKSHSSMLEEIYHKRFGVHLRLRLDRGTSLFEGKFYSGKFRFQAENIYLILLMHFAQQPNGRTSIPQLKAAFVQQEDIKVSPIESAVQVLLQCKLLIKDPNEDEVFVLNFGYLPPKGSKPQVPIQVRASPGLLRTLRQGCIDQSKIIKERQKLVDAMLVKLLKHAHATSGNRITFEQLYQGVRGNTFLKSLPLPQSLVKQRLQYLIVKEFCIRDEEDRRVYNYIA